jgi:hypothetical protein
MALGWATDHSSKARVHKALARKVLARKVLARNSKVAGWDRGRTSQAPGKNNLKLSSRDG